MRGDTLTSRDRKLKQIEKLITSSVLHGSDSLCRLLAYMATRELEQPGSRCEEYQIATDVFGRPSSFDPALDSTARVQTARLRAKLIDYYAHEGATDQLIVELPKDACAVRFRHRAPFEGKLPLATSTLQEEPLAPVRSKLRQHWVTFLVVAITIALISVAALGYFLATHGHLVSTPFAADKESQLL